MEWLRKLVFENEKVNLVTADGLKIKLKIRKLLGTGASGTIVSAKFIDLGTFRFPDDEMWKTCALKYCRSAVPSEAEAAKIVTIINLRHKNILRFLVYGSVTGIKGFAGDLFNWGIAQELCSDGTLNTLVRKKKLSNETIREYTTQILLGVEYLHSHRIIHTDLKGDNIYLTKNYTEIKIGDLDSHVALQGTHTSNDVTHKQGTWRWMSPEMVLLKADEHQPDAGRKVDVWSLACVVLEMFTRDKFILKKHNGDIIENNISLVMAAQNGYFPSAPVDLEAEDSKFMTFFKDCFWVNPSLRPEATELLYSVSCHKDPEDLPKLEIPKNSRRSPTDRPTSVSELSHDVIVVAGGKTTTSVEQFDPLLNEWSALSPLPAIRAGAGAAVLNNKIYIVGGGLTLHRSTIKYDASLMKWIDEGHPILHSYGYGGWIRAVAAFGSIYAVDTYMQIQRWDPRDHTKWTGLSPKTTPSSYRPQIGLLGDSLFACGGTSQDADAIDSFFRYELKMNTWEASTSMKRDTYDCGVACFGRYLYVTGGSAPFWLMAILPPGASREDDKYRMTKSCERYDAASSTWEFIDDMNQGRMTHSAVFADNKLYAMGGFSDLVENYDITEKAKKWTNCRPYETNGRFGACVATVRNF